jgi:hypothetical protein
VELVVDLSTKEVTVAHRDDLGRFAVRAVMDRPPTAGSRVRPGDLDGLAEAMAAHDVGEVGPDGDALVSSSGLRRLAGEAAARDGIPLGADWDTGFASMLDVASSKGWITDGGDVRAHVEWGS